MPLLLLIGGAIYGLPMLFGDGLPIRGYGVMMLLGIVTGVGLAAAKIAARFDNLTRRLQKLGPYALIATGLYILLDTPTDVT